MALLMARGGSFLVCIFIRNFEVKSTFKDKEMIVPCSRQRSFNTLYLVK